MLNPLYRIARQADVNVIQLTLPESLDDADFDRLMKEVLDRLDFDPAGAWVLDLTSITYAGSALLGLMVNVRQQLLGGGGRLVLCGLSPRLLGILHTCSLERLFKVARDRDDAVNWFD